MRTLLILACGAITVSHAQYQLPPQEELEKRCAMTWDNTKKVVSIDDIANVCPNMVARYGSPELAYVEVITFFANEDQGTVSDTSDGGHGPANVHRNHMYKDYRDRRDKNPYFVDFPFETLDDSTDFRTTLIILDWHFSPSNPYKFQTEDEYIMGWNNVLLNNERRFAYLERHKAYRRINLAWANDGTAHAY